VQRYKGLGEMDAHQLAETTMDPRHRTLRRITVDDADEAARVFELLMGSEVAPRKEFIVQGAYDVDVESLDAWANRASALLRDQAGVDVVHEAADLDRLRDQRVRADPADVLPERGQLVVDHVEGVPGGVLTRRRPDALLELALGVQRHRAPGVRDDQDSADAEQVHAQHERLQGRVGDPATGVAEDLGIPVVQPEHAQRVDARVHAGDDRDAGVRDAVEVPELEAARELLVGQDEIVVGTHGEDATGLPARP
jgi:hypothetical protein